MTHFQPCMVYIPIAIAKGYCDWKHGLFCKGGNALATATGVYDIDS